MRPCQAGFSLVEVTVAITLLLVGVLGSVALLNGANATTRATKQREGATNLAREIVEAAHSVPYAKITPTGVTALLQPQPGLNDHASGIGWTINRRDQVYTVTATACTLDDPADGVAAHDSAFCSDTATTSTQPADEVAEDYKRVVVDVSWKSSMIITRHVRLTTLVNNPGNPAGPTVTALALTTMFSGSADSPMIVTGSSASFSAVTSEPAATVGWSVDGVGQGNATGSGTTWNFSWPLTDVLDGSYTVAANGYDASGATAGARSLTVSLNRNLPLAPSQFVGGFNGTTVEFEWAPNKEGDIIGYRVYRVGSPNVLVCSTTAATTCRDTSPPSTSTIDYVIRALDSATFSGTPREGAATSLTVHTGNQAPNPPTNLSGTASGNTTTLNWTEASPLDPDGTPIAFYRIYRDGQAYGDRYGETASGTSTNFVDKNTGGIPHTYWVTAVDSDLAESGALGPVTK
jgi:Tfp pilus assembly protein PilV